MPNYTYRLCPLKIKCEFNIIKGNSTCDRFGIKEKISIQYFIYSKALHRFYLVQILIY